MLFMCLLYLLLFISIDFLKWKEWIVTTLTIIEFENTKLSQFWLYYPNAMISHWTDQKWRYLSLALPGLFILR